MPDELAEHQGSQGSWRRVSGKGRWGQDHEVLCRPSWGLWMLCKLWWEVTRGVWTGAWHNVTYVWKGSLRLLVNRIWGWGWTRKEAGRQIWKHLSSTQAKDGGELNGMENGRGGEMLYLGPIYLSYTHRYIHICIYIFIHTNIHIHIQLLEIELQIWCDLP